MAITINDFTIVNNGDELSIKLTTNVGHTFTSILLWDMYSFKDYSLAKDISYKIEASSEIEEFVVTAEELEIQKFEDLYFIEVKSTAPTEECPDCLIPALGITYNLSPYYQCLLDNFIDLEISNCNNCNNIDNKNLVLTISLLIESIEKSIQIGFYMNAISHIEKLKKLCLLKGCTNCNQSICNSCGNFNQIS